MKNRIKKSPSQPSRPANPAGGIYPRFHQSPKALVGREYGRPGLQYFMPGYIRRDFLPELQGRQLWLTYEQMASNDAYVGSALNAYSLFIRRTTWHVDPVDDRNEENGSAEFLRQCMDDMQHSWQTIIATAAKPCLTFGFVPFEKIFKERAGELDDERYTSDYDDGNIGWANLAIRSPDTILHWDYDPQDVTRLIGFTQIAAPDFHTTFIPIQKTINLRAEPWKDSPEGRSILRTVWRSWRTKTINEDLRNVTAELGGAGIPWAEVPANIANAPEIAAANPDNPAALEALASYNSIVDTLESIQLGSQKWVITPQVWDSEGRPQIKISFLQPSQNADIIGHITGAIDSEAKAILIATMTEFQALGLGGTGSLALSRDKTDNFTLAVAATATSFQESINSQGVKQLFRLNPEFEFEKGQPRPKIVYDPLVPLSTQDIVAILTLFERAGWDLSKQGGIRDAIIKNLGLPDYIEQETNDELQENGGEPIENMLEGTSALDQIMGPGFEDSMGYGDEGEAYGMEKSHRVRKQSNRRRRTHRHARQRISKVKDDTGHCHDDAGHWTACEGGSSGAGKEKPTLSDEAVQDAAADAAAAIKEKYGDETSCGDVADAVFNSIKDSGHDVKVIDEGGHVYVADYTSRIIIDHAKETTDRLGDEIIDFDDAGDNGYKLPENVKGAKHIEVHGKKIISR